MSEVIAFYEKPGCIGNQQQKALLRNQGHQLKVQDLLGQPWTETKLRPFFGNKPVSQWFNQSAPKIKSGEIAVESLDEAKAIELMLAEPLLICRPLMQYKDKKQSGFLQGPVVDALNIPLDPQEDLQSCPMTDDAPVCGEASQ